jgi:HSP20 family protein
MVKPLNEQKLSHKIHTQKSHSLTEEFEHMRDAIMRRAYEIFASRPYQFAGPLDDWLAAEREMVWQPQLAVTENDTGYTLEVAVPGLKADDIEVHSTEEEILVKSSACPPAPEGETVHVCEFPRGRVFRSVTLPRKIERDKVSAELHDGILRITVPAAKAEVARKVPVAA